jgi:hypothetical protein
MFNEQGVVSKDLGHVLVRFLPSPIFTQVDRDWISTSEWIRRGLHVDEGPNVIIHHPVCDPLWSHSVVAPNALFVELRDSLSVAVKNSRVVFCQRVSGGLISDFDRWIRPK